MDKAAKNKLMQFLENNIPVDDLMKAGFFLKGTRKNSYEKIAARICWYFSFKNIYEYKKICHGKLCDGENCDGRNKYCKNYKEEVQVLLWPKLEVCQAEMAGKDSWLN